MTVVTRAPMVLLVASLMRLVTLLLMVAARCSLMVVMRCDGGVVGVVAAVEVAGVVGGVVAAGVGGAVADVVVRSMVSPAMLVMSPLMSSMGAMQMRWSLAMSMRANMVWGVSLTSSLMWCLASSALACVRARM